MLCYKVNVVELLKAASKLGLYYFLCRINVDAAAAVKGLIDLIFSTCNNHEIIDKRRWPLPCVSVVGVDPVNVTRQGDSATVQTAVVSSPYGTPFIAGAIAAVGVAFLIITCLVCLVACLIYKR